VAVLVLPHYCMRTLETETGVLIMVANKGPDFLFYISNRIAVAYWSPPKET
jgi:hypothetical protein